MTRAEIECVTGAADPTLGQAVELLACSVPSSCAGLVPYHAPGYRLYLAAALFPRPDARTIILRCLRTGSDLYAIADWRLLGRTLFLNGIAVREGERRMGHGSQLLRDGLALARHLGCSTLGLDVSFDNPRARCLYERMGFVDESWSAWMTVESAPQPDAASVRVLDWSSFSILRATYGFGDIRVSTSVGPMAARVVGTALRVPPGPDGAWLASVLSPVTGTWRSYAICGDPRREVAFARFARMTRQVDSEGTRARSSDPPTGRADVAHGEADEGGPVPRNSHG